MAVILERNSILKKKIPKGGKTDSTSLRTKATSGLNKIKIPAREKCLFGELFVKEGLAFIILKC